MDSADIPITPRGVLLISQDPTMPDGVKMEQLTVLTTEEHARYHTAHRRVNNLLLGGILTYFQLSDYALRATIAEANLAHAENRFQPQTRPNEAMRLISELRTAVLSVVSAVYFHQDQTYQLASDLHPGDKSVRAEIEKVFNGLFDANRSYRLLYALRNLMTLQTMEAVSVHARVLQVAPERVEARFRFRMDRALAVRSTVINKIAKADLVQMQDDPDVIELLDEVRPALYQADQRISTLLYPDMRELCETIIEFDRLFQGKPGIRALVNDWQPDKRGQLPTWSSWAAQVFEFAARQLVPLEAP